MSDDIAGRVIIEADAEAVAANLARMFPNAPAPVIHDHVPTAAERERERDRERRRHVDDVVHRLLPALHSFLKQNNGKPAWVVVRYGNVGEQIAMIATASAVRYNKVRAFKWRKNSKSFTRTAVTIQASEIRRVATSDDFKRAGLHARVGK